MSYRPPTYEMNDLTNPEIAYYGGSDQSQSRIGQEAKEHLISRNPVMSQEIHETTKQSAFPGRPVSSRYGGFSSGYEHVQRYEGNPWLPGFWVQFPWDVILPLVGCLICLSGSIAILVRSDGQPVDHWSLAPTVYLAILTTVTNMLLRYAFKQGMAISWWYKAVRGGTLQDLHKHWSSGDGFWSALFAGRHFNLASLGSIAATLIVIDQPLIQRSSTIVSVPRTFLTNVTATIAPEIPFGYTGYQSGRGSEQQLMTQPMIAAFNDYNTQVPITSGFTGCRDTCEGYIEAGGLAAQCSTVTGPVQYLTPVTLGVGMGPDGSYSSNIFQYDSVFGVNFTLFGPAYDSDYNVTSGTQLYMITAYSTDPTGECGATRTQRSCSLRPATLRYPVTIANGTLTLGNTTADATVTVISPQGNSTDAGGDFTLWTLGGMYVAAKSLFDSNGTYDFSGGHGFEVFLPDTLSNQFLDIKEGPNMPYNQSADIPSGQLYTGLGIPEPCNNTWSDPTDHIISSLNQIAFRVSMRAATYPYRYTNSPPEPQVTPMLETANINVFKSDRRYLIANTILTIFFMALVLPSFIGWWELGRKVSLDPVEIAKAFDAPMFQGPGSNAPLHQLVGDYGQRRVQYGEMEGAGSGIIRRQLKLGNPQELTRPVAGTVYD